MQQVSINVVRCNALFVSWLQPSTDPAAAEVRQAITEAVRRFRSTGCAARVAQEFGDHPDTAVQRMRWSRRTVDEVFGRGTPRTRTWPCTVPQIQRAPAA